MPNQSILSCTTYDYTYYRQVFKNRFSCNKNAIDEFEYLQWTYRTQRDFDFTRFRLLHSSYSHATVWTFPTNLNELSISRFVAMELVRPLPVTFHRAIDMTSDIFAALEAVISLGFTRVLTSGGCNTALDGVPVIAELVKQFHCSARSAVDSLMGYRHGGVSMGASVSPPEYSVKVTDSNKVQKLVNLADKY
ncbi:hypothetical protein KUTeg_004768 [Tegillarca granosa]|uniref:Copper homeostasis protein cutC homolog n=1 Tax=Tegillarca granosa TaxID=220873 RepID=A0ABQ9FHV9_TEGGR|nr:hypothetical protein KUTeg_004768 [Tegillarca granosa]